MRSGRTFFSLLRDESGAVAATYALSLVGLVAIAGVAFDYAHMMGMQSELQNGADQAALAGATQLDGNTGACSRAATAAINLVNNSTLLADDNNTITIANETTCDATGNVRFWQDADRTTAATSDANAHFIELKVDARTADFSFTPITGLLYSTLSAAAEAGIGSAICNVPPVMICNPNESADPDFTTSNYIGKGIKLVSVGSGGGAWAPGNFGYLNSQGGANGAPGLRQALGWTDVPGNCQPGSGVDTKPGATTTVTDSLNTRFDAYTNVSCPTGGSCPPSANSVKDLIKKDGTSGNACKIGPNGWQEADHPYLPSSSTNACSGTYPCTTSGDSNYPYPDAMGYPRDMCHAVSSSGVCGGTSSPVGDGIWDIDAYFHVNYGGATHAQWVSALKNSTYDPITVDETAHPTPPYGVTRYDIYKWEMDNAGSAINGVTILGTRTVSGSGGNTLKAHGAPYCSPPGVTPGGDLSDRRRLSVAVVNCTANSVNGSSTGVPVKKWLDVFLVEPSVNRSRTSQTDVYVEVIKETGVGGDGTAGQVVRRDVPYLVR